MIWSTALKNARVGPWMASVVVATTLAGCGGCSKGVGDEDGGPGDPNQGASTSGGLMRPDGGGGNNASGGTNTSGGQQGSSGTSGANGSGGASGNTGTSSGQVSSGGASSSSSGFVSGCVTQEVCNDGLDNNCNDLVDEECGCIPGDTQPCYEGDPAHAGVGVCTPGTQTCVSNGEVGMWAACAGSVAPQAVQCGSGVDYACVGNPDHGCVCSVGQVRACYSGPPATAGVGLCRSGSQNCVQQAPGVVAWTACSGEVLPAMEACDDRDHDCDSVNDTGCGCVIGTSQPCYSGAVGTQGVGLCRAGSQACVATANGSTWGACGGEVTPQTDVCDGVDRNCDGNPNTGCGCVVGTTQPCYGGPAGTAGVGTCQGGTQTCVAAGGGAMWGGCMGEVLPQPDQCDGVDRNCDNNPNTACACTAGQTQPCYDGPPATNGVGTCHGGTQACVVTANGSSFGACTGQVLPQQTQACDGTDRMCNNMPGAGCVCAPGQTQPCYTGPAGTQGVGVCQGGTQTCTVVNGTLQFPMQCDGQVTPQSMDICGNGLDDNCAGGVDENCTNLMCPPDQTIDAGTLVNLTATATGLSGFSWRIVNQPAGAGSSAEWTPNPPNAQTVGFRPYIVGVYTLEASARDGGGALQTCVTNITARAHGLRVEVTWDGAGDVDVHLHNAVSSSPWFGGTSGGNPNDCYYENCIPPPIPSWSSVPGPAPWGASLDVDNITANGPENVNVATPALSSDYTISIHNWSDAAGRVATVKVFCGLTAGVTPTQVFTSRALTGNTSGDCSTNDFWRVARVNFQSAGVCTITPINSYATSASACASF